MGRFSWIKGRALGWLVVALIAVLIAGGVAFAQGQGGGRRGGGPGFGGPGIELRGLDLTDAQRDQIRDITQRYQQQMRNDILLVLTPEQQQKFKANEAERDARIKQFQQQRRQQQGQQQNP